MEPQILMSSRERDHFLARHDFYMKQIKTRLLRNFDNMEEEAEQINNELSERLTAFDSEGGDMSARAEIARHDGMAFFLFMRNLQIQTTLGALTSLYHQWEKDLRGFMQRQITASSDGNKIRDYFWKRDITKLFDALERFGWPIREAQFYNHLESCRLIVNVYKHGKGNSLNSLVEYYPQYLKKRFRDFSELPFLANSRHEDLEVTEAEFDQIAEGIRQFWTDFPKRLVLATDPNTDRT